MNTVHDHIEATTASIDPARCAWGLLPAGLVELGRLRPGQPLAGRPEALDEALQALLPGAVAELHVVYFVWAEGKVLAIGIDRADVQKLALSETLALVPESVPAFIALPPGVTAGDLNLLEGEQLPKPIRAQRRRRTLVTAGGILVVVALSVLGLERRISATAAQARVIEQASAEVVARAAPGAPNPDEGLRRLERELARQRATHLASVKESQGATVLKGVEGLLRAWPRDEHTPLVQTERLEVGPGSVTLSVIAETRHDGLALVEALRELPGWTLMQPQWTTLRGGKDDAASTERSRINLRLVSNESPKAAGSGGSMGGGARP